MSKAVSRCPAAAGAGLRAAPLLFSRGSDDDDDDDDDPDKDENEDNDDDEDEGDGYSE